MMSENSTTSSESNSNQNAKAVLDFLYYDRARVGSLLAQFYPDAGLRNAVRSVQGSVSTDAEKTAISGEGNALFARLTGSGERSAVSEIQRSIENQYGPVWSNALQFLRLIKEQGLLRADHEPFGLGDLVEMSGKLTVADLGLVKRMLANKTVYRAIAGGQKTPGAVEKDVQLAFLQELPHSIEATISGRRDAWFTLDPVALTITPTDLMLKHGVVLAGMWSVIGIYDARKGEGGPIGRPSDDFKEKAGRGGVRTFAEFFAPMARTFFGRPMEFDGLTPLLIYRRVFNTN